MLSSDEDDESRMIVRMKVAGVSSREEVWMTVHWLVAGGSISVCCRPLPGARCQVLRGLVVVVPLVQVHTQHSSPHTHSPVSSLQSTCSRQHGVVRCCCWLALSHHQPATTRPGRGGNLQLFSKESFIVLNPFIMYYKGHKYVIQHSQMKQGDGLTNRQALPL